MHLFLPYLLNDSQTIRSTINFFHDINMKWLGIRFRNDLFKWFRVDSFFWETITLYTVHFQI